MVENKHH